MKKVTIHPSISRDLKKVLDSMVGQKIEMEGIGDFSEFRNFSHLVEYLLQKGLKAHQSECRRE